MDRPEPGPAPSRTLSGRLAGALMAMQLVVLIHASATDFVVRDESAHLASGLVHWKTLDFRPFDVNPPAVRMLGTLPLIALDPSVPLPDPHPSAAARPEWILADALARANPDRYVTMFRLARWISVALTCLTSWVIWSVGRRRYGEVGGLIALSLWCTSPLALGHGHLLTSDAAAACLGLIADQAVGRFRSERDSRAALAAGVATSLALLAKFTLLILVPYWVAKGLAPGPMDGQGWRGRVARVASALAMGLLVIHLAYGFNRPLTPLGEFSFLSTALAGPDPSIGGGNRFRSGPFARLPVPLPGNLIEGIDRQWSDFGQNFRSYLRGEYRRGGWWYYPLYGLAVKEPLGHLLTVALAFGLALARRPPGSANPWADWFPGLLILGFVCMQSGFSHHIRYVLPCLPFLYLGAGSLGPRVVTAPRWLGIPIGLLMLASFCSVAANHPHHLAYFNEAAGGPSRGHLHLLDSNIDWGQDLLRLRDWLKAHPEVTGLHLAVLHLVDPTVLGLDYRLPDRGSSRVEPGWYVVGTNVLFGFSGWLHDGQGGKRVLEPDDYAAFRGMRPYARIGWSLWVFRVDPARAGGGDTP